jgi:hypothetical protein
VSALVVRNSELASISLEKTMTSLSFTPMLTRPLWMASTFTPEYVFTKASNAWVKSRLS